MAIKSIIPEHGEKEHIIVNENGGLYDIIVACGHNHFKDEGCNTFTYSSINEIPNDKLCSRCEKRMRK